MPYFTQAARRSIQGGGSTRSFFGSTASISWVNAPYAQIRPQYSRPHSTVDATVKIANTYQSRLYLTIGRFQSMTPKMFTMEIRLLLKNPMYPTAMTSVTYFSATLFLKNPTSANAMNPV